MRIGAIITATTAIAALAAGVQAATNLTIKQAGQQFSEKSIAVTAGDTVVFSNDDEVTHNITIINDDDDSTDLGLQQPGQNLTYKFDKAGRFKIRCSIHPRMKMTVDVK